MPCRAMMLYVAGQPCGQEPIVKTLLGDSGCGTAASAVGQPLGLAEPRRVGVPHPLIL
jgi:hypothetical protein